MTPTVANVLDRVRRHRLPRAAARVLLWAAVILVVGRGVVSLFTGPAGAAAKTTASTANNRTDATFPGPDAVALAERFAADYLTYDDASPTDWQHRLADYGPALAVGWDGKGHQTITTVVPAATDPAGPGAATVTVAARTTARWIYLAVPVVATPAGPAIAGHPAFIAAPTPDAAPSPIAATENTDPAAADALRPTVEAFLTAWAAGTQPVIAALSADDARLARADVGAATLADITALTVERAAPAATERAAVAILRWADPQSGASFSQPYRLTLLRVGERWLVRSIGPDVPAPAAPPSSPRPPNKKEK